MKKMRLQHFEILCSLRLDCFSVISLENPFPHCPLQLAGLSHVIFLISGCQSGQKEQFTMPSLPSTFRLSEKLPP